MAGHLIPRLEDSGAGNAQSSNAPFLLDDPDSLWLVEAGALDLFLVRVHRDDIVDARFQLTRLEAGNAAFGLVSDARGFSIAGCALPGTRVVRLSLSAARRDATDGQHNFLAPLLEQWITTLNSIVSEETSPRISHALEPNQHFDVDEQIALAPKTSMVWIGHDQGHSYFNGRHDLPAVHGNGFFPVSANSWLATEPGSRLRILDSHQLLRADPEWQGLCDFHAKALACLVEKKDRAAARDAARMRMRKAADSARLSSAMARLAALIRTIPILLETEETCADPLFLACQVVGKKIGVKIKPDPDTLRGAPAADPVAAMARSSGVRIRKVALRGEWWNERVGALLAFHENGNTPLAILPCSSGRLELHNPSNQQVHVVDSEIAAQLNPLAYVFYRPFPAKAMGIFDLLHFGLFDCHRELITVVLMGIATGLMAAITPYMTGVIFDRLIPGAERGALLNTAMLLIVVAISSAMFAFVRGLAVLRMEGKIDVSLQAASWDRLLSLPVSFFREYTSGDLAQRSLGISHIREILTSSTLTALLSGIFSIFSFLLLFYYSWKLALEATALVGFASAVCIFCGVLQLRHQRELAKLQGAISSMLLQLIHGIAKLRVSGSEERAFSAWARPFSRQKQIATKMRRIANSLTIFNSVFPMVGITAVFWLYSIIGAGGAKGISTGSFLAFLAAFTQFLSSTLFLCSTAVYALGIVPTYERARPIFRTLPEVTEGKVAPGRLTGNIEISHVSFRYRPDTPLVLRDLTLSIRPRQFIAFVGASGSGKSTLFRLILGFENPESGAIYYDGHDLAALDVQAVRKQIGVVLQASRPVGGSIFENIAGSAPYTLEEAWEAARMSGLAEDIERMPMGMHTHITDGGGGISGGQRQRLMIARAIVGKPRILVFDEATSALDNHTQAIVSRSLEGLLTTRIVIAHRLSTVIHADRIYVIEKGTISQSGTYRELLEQEGLFRELVKRQLA